MAFPAFAQGQATPSASANQKPLAYEVISIAPSNPAAQNRSWRNTPDGMTFINVPLSMLVKSAFDIIADDQLSGLPRWADSSHYDIQAKMSDEDVAAWKKLTRDEKGKQEKLLLQSLLTERCQLKFHRETRQLPVYDLVIAKGGLNMQEAKPMVGSRTMTGGGKFNGQSVSIESLTYSLSNEVGHVVIDKTGLGEKKFDIDLNWTPDEQQGTPEAGPTLFAALEEQLGLKLVASKGPVETVVIEQMEKPTPN
jgi:uncharacterized protein (TIGR03435 family)